MRQKDGQKQKVEAYSAGAGATAIHLFNYDCHSTGIRQHNTQEHIGLDNVHLFSQTEY